MNKSQGCEERTKSLFLDWGMMWVCRGWGCVPWVGMYVMGVPWVRMCAMLSLSVRIYHSSIPHLKRMSINASQIDMVFGTSNGSC